MTDTRTFLVPTQPSDQTAVIVDGFYSHITNHVDDAIGLLIDRLRDGPRNQGFLAAMVQPVQDLEDALFSESTAFDIDTATGDQLILLGKQVGQAADGRSDADLRAAIRTKTLCNRSNGKAPQLLAVAASVDPTATKIQIRGLFPKSYAIWFDAMTCTPENARQVLKSATAAGTRVIVEVGGITIGGSSVAGGTIGGSTHTGDLIGGGA